MRIQHNIMAMGSYRNYTNNVSAMKKNLEKLSSGYKINRAGDDAAGLAISEKMRAQITGLKQAQANAKSGINLVQTAEGALQEVQDMLNRMVKLAEQSANGTYEDKVDRKQLQKEFTRLTEEIDRINKAANFNGKTLFGGASDAAAAGSADPLTATKDTSNELKLGDVKVTFAADATDEEKKAFNEALAATTMKITGSGSTSGWSTTTGPTIDKLPEGYTATYKDASGAQAAYTAGTKLTVATSSATDKLKQGDDLEITLSKGGKAVATITIGKPTATVTNKSTTITFAAPAGKAKAAEAAAPTWADADSAKTELAKFGLESIDFSGVDIKADTDVKVKYGTDKKLTVTVGDKVYTSDALADNATTLQGKEIELSDGSGNKIKAKVAADNAKIGSDKTTAITEAKVGVVKAPAADADDGEGTKFTFQIGDTNEDHNKITVNIKSIASTAIKDISEGTEKTLSELNVETEDDAGEALKALKGMVNYISDIRGDLGATQNRLDHTINNLSVMEENIQDAESTIRDTDIAEEMMAYTKNNILIQSAQAMLAQANQVPQGVLQLLQ